MNTKKVVKHIKTTISKIFYFFKRLLLETIIIFRKVFFLFPAIYNLSTRALQSKLGKKLAHFFSHGALHFISGITIAIICWLLYQEINSNTYPQYKHVEISAQNNNLPVSFIEIYAWINNNDINEIYNNEQAMVITIGYNQIEITDSFVVSKDDILYFYNNNKNCIPKSICPFVEMKDKNNFKSYLEVYSPGSNIQNAGLHKNNIYFDRLLNHLSHIDSIDNDYIRFSTYYSIYDKAYGIHEAITGNILSFNKSSNPYSRFFLELKDIFIKDTIAESCNIVIKLSDCDSTGQFKNPIHIQDIFPAPTIMRPDRIEYRGSEKMKEVIENGGIYGLMEDLNKKSKSDRHIFFYTVMLGALLAFLLDIIVNLIIKWRNLVDKL